MAEAFAAAMHGALAAAGPGGGACFNALLMELDDGAAAAAAAAGGNGGGEDRGDPPPASVARPALAPHARPLFCEAARRGARGALQALLVCLPEYSDALDGCALEAARAAGQQAAAWDIRVLLELRERGEHAGAAGGATTAAAAEAAEPLQLRGSGSCNSLSDLDVFIDAASSGLGSASGLSGGGSGAYSSSPGGLSCGTPRFRAPCGARGADGTATRAGGGGAAAAVGGGGGSGSFSSVPSSAAGGGSAGGSSRASSTRGSDCGCPGAVCGGSAAAAAAAPFDPQQHSGGCGAGARAAQLQAALRRAVHTDDVTTAAQLLTSLVDATDQPQAASGQVPVAAAGAEDDRACRHHHQPYPQPLDAFVVDLLAASGAAGTTDCAHLLLTAVRGSEDGGLGARACRAMCLAAAARGRCGVLRVCLAHHQWAAEALAADGAALAHECLRAAVLCGHPHTAAWIGGRVMGATAAQLAVESLLAAPPELLQQELASLTRATATAAAAAAGGPEGGPAAAEAASPRARRRCRCGKAPEPAAPDVAALVAAFWSAWAEVPGCGAA